MARQLSLLIVNASESERATITLTLNKLEVFEIIECEDSQAALHLLKQRAVDLIITGLDVGKIDGWRFARMVRSGLLETPKHTPIVLTPPIYCERIAETTARSYSIDAVLPFEKHEQLPELLANVLSTQLEKSSRLDLLLFEPDHTQAEEICEQLEFSFACTVVNTLHDAQALFLQNQYAIVLINTSGTTYSESKQLIGAILELSLIHI